MKSLNILKEGVLKNSMTVFMKDNKRTTRTTRMMETINDILYLCGLPHFWVEPVSFSEKFTKIYNVVSFVCQCLNLAFTVLLLASFVTQNKLTDKQRADRFVVSIANPISHLFYFVFLYHREEVRNILYKLLILLKLEHNDEVEEKTLIGKYKMYVSGFLGSSIVTLIFSALFGLYQVSTGLPFVTLITAWPDVEDVTAIAEVARVFFYFYWWIYFLQISGVYLLLLAILIGLSQQYKNLQSYFYSLNKIFSEDLEQVEKEEKFEKSFIRGVQMHSETIWTLLEFIERHKAIGKDPMIKGGVQWCHISQEIPNIQLWYRPMMMFKCLNQTSHVCSLVFDVQMLLGIINFVSLLPVLMSPDRDVGALANVPMVLLCLIVTGYFMWNAGDISVEASFLPDAMYASGWNNCCNDYSIRIRKLVVISMAQAKQPVIIKALGFIELSYNSYLGIIKTSHSVFSVFY